MKLDQLREETPLSMDGLLEAIVSLELPYTAGIKNEGIEIASSPLVRISHSHIFDGRYIFRVEGYQAESPLEPQQVLEKLEYIFSDEMKRD